MKISVIGYFGYVTNQIDGQTIKTRQLYQILKRNLPGANISFVDTQRLQTQKYSTLFALVRAAIKSDIVVYLPGQNNLSGFFPKLSRLSRLFHTKIIYPVVGGWLADFLKDKPDIAEDLKSIAAVLVESPRLKQRLESEYGFCNVEVFPNFRITGFLPEINRSSPHRLVFMARICEEKGCGYLLNFARKYSESHPDSNLIIDFYGQIAPDYADTFHSLIKQARIARYRGAVEPDEVFKTLAQYDVMVLPTFYEGEGFPGSIVDSYFAGIPVIVTDWKDLADFVSENNTGFIIPAKNQAALDDSLNKFLQLSENRLAEMKQAALKESQEYNETAAWQILKKYLSNVQS